MLRDDTYLYEGSPVLRNLLNIHDEKELDIAEAELSQANIVLLYEQGFDDFSTQGIKTIHKVLFEDVYDWAGEFRTINIQKREPLLVGISVWYADSDNIKKDLDLAWKAINSVQWSSLSREEFAAKIARLFPSLWQAHPFREGNTRTIVMLMTFLLSITIITLINCWRCFNVEILTPKEASELLKISEYTILNYARKGKIPARKIANRWRFSKDELLGWFGAPTLDILLKEAEQEYREGKTVRLWPSEQ